MSFITKRERVFNDYDLVDLPPRNEGKLKAYASCTDTRAWSHFCATKSEHLTEIIKRNNNTLYPPKYVPTKVIVDTIMVTKNLEIARLKSKIEEFEQMLAVYDDLDLDCNQKCEIAKAHATIKAANKNLDDMVLNLNSSYFTEGMDSEAFETGKSRGGESLKSKGEESDRSHGDEWNFEDRKQLVSMETETIDCSCDACVSVTDPRIDEMKDEIISRDAKLNAMRNTLAVMENDVCEPYGIYAHIYTALEKIHAILSQNPKYRQYLSLMTAGKDTRSIDIKGKILFKLKILEKFCLALIAPCSREFVTQDEGKECKCYRAEVITRVDTSYPAKLHAENSGPDVKRLQLIANIMDHDEMKQILDIQSTADKLEQEPFEIDELDTRYCINEENQKRLKDLQASYEELMNCYENLKYEKDCLQVRCLKYDELEAELEQLRIQLREYNSLWNEKEHYKKRSEDLDSLKEQYMVLAEESSGLETKLKAESEINSIKSSAVDDLRHQNVFLEKKINDIYLKFEREKNALQCKLQEAECKCMCQEQQIKSLSTQIVQVLEQQPGKVLASDDAQNPITLISEKESLKDQIKNLQDLEEEFQDKLSIITELKGDVDVWRNSYEKVSERNKYLEECVENQEEERMKLVEENKALQKAVYEKTGAVENLMEMINNKSKEINKLMDQNHTLMNQLDKLKAKYENHVAMLDNEKKQVLSSLQLSRQESKELLQKVKDYDYFVQKQEDLSQTIEEKMQEFESIKRILKQKIEENEKLKRDLAALQNEDKKSKKSIDLAKKESLILEQRLSKLESVSQQFISLKDAYEKLNKEKIELENELKQKVSQLDSAIYSVKLNKKESSELLKQHESVQEQLEKMNLANQSLLTHNNFLSTSLNDLREENEHLKRKSAELNILEQELSDLKNCFNDLLREKQRLEHDFDNKNHEMSNLYDSLEKKIEENRCLQENIKSLEIHNLEKANSIQALENEKLQKIAALDTYRRESSILIQKLQLKESLEKEYDKLKAAHDQMALEKERLQKSLEAQLEDLKKFERENQELYGQTNHLLSVNSDLEETLMTTRNELIVAKSNPEKPLYTDLVVEVHNMKEEKLKGQKKIRELLNQLDESENFNSHLKEKLCARDDKIAIMQNQINELEAEMRKLQGTLAQAIDTGNAIKSSSFRNIDQSVKQLEAHHSKATHNIKMELAMLQNANTKLEDQLSVTRLQSLEASNVKQEYLTQLRNLNNEREIIVTDIKQLEMHCVGDSELMPQNCAIEQILASLDRIRGCFNARNSKNTSLEQTLLKVKTSSQLFLSKADDAKKYFEKEKQKIFNEKEDALKEKLNLEKQLVNQKKQLEGQISHYQGIIKDLEAEILNQKLITDKLNDSTKNYILKLKEEVNSFHDLYQNAETKMKELQEKNKACESAKEEIEILMKKLANDFDKKSKEVAELKGKLSDLLNKPKVNQELQVTLSENKKNSHMKYTQTSNLPDTKTHDKIKPELKLESDESAKRLKEIAKTPISVQSRQKDTNNPPSELVPEQKPTYSVNEVQILTANVEPSFDFVKNSYQNYKIKRLSPGQLEHHSIPDQSTSAQSAPNESSTIDGETHQAAINSGQDPNQTSSNFINIYSRPSNDMTISSKLLNNSPHKQDSQSPVLTNDSYRTESNVNIQRYGDHNILYTPSKSTDKDVLVIYRDSESVFEKKPYDQEEIWSDEGDHKTGNKKLKLPANKSVKSDDFDQFPVQTVYSETKVKKPRDKQKIKIALPRVGNEGTSLWTTSDRDKKSLDSFSVSNYDLPKRNNFSDTKLVVDISGKGATSSLPSVSNEKLIYGGSRHSHEMPSEDEMRSKKRKKHQEIHRKLSIHDTTSDLASDKKSRQNAGKQSHHELARVGADAFLIKSTDDQDDNANSQANQNNFALEYILDTVKREGNVHHLQGYEASDELIQNHSENRHGSNKINSFEQPAQSVEFSTSQTRSKASEKSRTISVERSVMTMPDETSEYYTKIIQNLTKTLENVEKEYKKKLDAIKAQYDRNINNIINEHNQGVKNIQSLHEETLHDIMKVHENEVDNLRSMSMEAMRKADRLEKENMSLKAKCKDSLGNSPGPDEMPAEVCSPELRGRKLRARCDTKVLTKTTVEAFNVKPKRLLGPCTCSLDVNISDTIRNIFEQVGVEQRKLAEVAYLKYIAGKISNGNIEGLDAQELSFLHLKVCRTWKQKLSKEEALQKKIDSLEVELINRQRNAQQHMAELDRKVAEEKQRLEQVREAVYRNNSVKPPSQASEGKELLRKNTASCCCNTDSMEGVGERRSAGDLFLPGSLQQKKTRTDSNRAVLAKLDVEEQRRERKLYTDEPPTRLRRQHDRPPARRK